jgi:hypothetical protein
MLCSALCISLLVPSILAFNFGGGGGGNCQIPCASGTFPAFKDAAVTPLEERPGNLAFTANGCGTDAVRVSTPEEVVPCCTVHDACYSICGVDRAFCDKEFSTCLERECSKLPRREDVSSCMESKQMLSMGVTMFGCGAFTEAQREMCTCATKASRTTQLQKLVTHRLYGHPKMPESSKKSEQEIDDIARRIGDSPKYSAMIHHILQKYNASLILFKSRDGNTNSNSDL